MKLQDNKGLTNSSFSLDENVKQYDDLIKANYIEYFRKTKNIINTNRIVTKMVSIHKILQVINMYNRATKKVVIDAGHPSLDKPNVIVMSCSK